MLTIIIYYYINNNKIIIIINNKYFKYKHTYKAKIVILIREKKRMNGAKLDYTQCDSPLHEGSKSLRKLLTS